MLKPSYQQKTDEGLVQKVRCSFKSLGGAIIFNNVIVDSIGLAGSVFDIGISDYIRAVNEGVSKPLEGDVW